MQQLQLLVLRI